MTEKKIVTSYLEYDSLDELSPEDLALAREAIEAQKTSYAPYSHFNVGAAVRLGNGVIVRGSNQENAASPSGLCAERTAMFAASAAWPGEVMEAIAIVGGYSFMMTGEPCSPCGSCRQVMAEYQMKGGKEMSILLIGAKVIYKFSGVDALLPFIFDSLEVKPSDA